MNNKIIDCITFFDDNLMFELRYNILKKHVDFFIICESKFDHRNNYKDINFVLKNEYDNSRIKHVVIDEKFSNQNNVWKNQAFQREYILKNLTEFDPDDYIFFSDPDEIPNPEIFENFKLDKKYGIFFQKCFNYKFNLFNRYESPWEGTRVCKKKNLRSIDFMRQKVKSKNLKYKFYRIDKERNIQIFENAGWHFNNILSPKEISRKLKTFAHTEFSQDKFSDEIIIQKKIEKRIDLFERNHEYEKINFDKSYPKYLLDNMKKYKDFIL